MIIQFKEITFQNILSFGNVPTTISFVPGVSLISGLNGQGKSALIDALSFCLYGQPYRKIKIKDLINRKNKKNLKVSCTFQVNGSDEIQIVRTLSPDSIEIFKNGQELEVLSSKKLTQDEIDKIIGLNYSLFKQVIALAVNYNKPFLALSAQEKRDIIEQIFDIKIFGTMLKNLKKKNVDIKTKNEIHEKSLSMLEQNLKSLKKQVAEINEAQVNFQTNKDNDLKQLEDKLKKYQDSCADFQKQLTNLSDCINKTLYDESILKKLYENREIAVKTINEREYDVETCQQKIKVLEINQICPSCGSKIPPEHKDAEIHNLFLKIDDNRKTIESSNLTKSQIDQKISKQENWKSELNNNRFQQKSVSEKIEFITKEILSIEAQIKQVAERKLDINLDSINTEFQDKQIEYKNLWKELQAIKKTLKINDAIQNILSENGIKAYFFKKLIPILNQKINEYIRLFELPVVIEFDELMNEKITNIDNLKHDIPYFSYSEGEKKRIDMAILLSFISITKNISNWNCNLLIIDELLDGAIDESGLDKLVASLKNMTYDNLKLCVYIISHRLQQDYSSQFKTCLKISKDRYGFSNIQGD